MPDSETGTQRILVVEDEPHISQICERVLTAEGFEVELAADGSIAQIIIDKGKHDLYLIDMRTPLMSGKELYQWMKEKYPDSAKRVVFTTGDMMSGDTQSFLKEAARPFLPKPFTPDELKNAIIEALRQMES